MRYEIGEKYVFLRVRYSAEPDDYAPLYFPWEHTLEGIDTLLLSCVEHHKVADMWDSKDEKKHDGFIFLDSDGNRYLNQYPTASFGQLSDHENYLVESENAQTLDEEFEDALYRIGMVANALRPVEEESVFHRSVLDIEGAEGPMRDFLQTLIDLTEKTSGRKVVVSPWIAKTIDGQTFETKVLQAKFVEEEKL